MSECLMGLPFPSWVALQWPCSRQGPWVRRSAAQTVQVLGMPRCVYVALEAVRPAVFGSQVSPEGPLSREGTLSCLG